MIYPSDIIQVFKDRYPEELTSYDVCLKFPYNTKKSICNHVGKLKRKGLIKFVGYKDVKRKYIRREPKYILS